MNYIERSQKREEIKLMSGWDVHWTCSRLVSIFDIFSRNSYNLLNFLENIPCFSFKLFPDENARLQKIDSDTETLRLIHNYIASAITLTDHSRRIKRKYLESNSQTKYDELIKENLIDPRSLLIIGLRNFILHVDLPSICNQINRMDGSSQVTLLPDKLLEWDNWRADVKSYLLELSNHNEKVMLNELFTEYSKKRFEFCEWFIKEIISNHYNELEQMYSLHQEVLNSVKEDGFISDPLIVQFFTRDFRLTKCSTRLGDKTPPSR